MQMSRNRDECTWLMLDYAFSEAGIFVILLSRKPSAKVLYMKDSHVSKSPAKLEKPVSAVKASQEIVSDVSNHQE